MTRLPPPLRFLVGVCAGWTCARAALLGLAAWQAGGVAPFPTLSAPRAPAAAGPAAAAGGGPPFHAPRAAAAASGGMVTGPGMALARAEIRSSRPKSRGAPATPPPAPLLLARPAPAPVMRPSTSAERPKPVLSAAAGGVEGLGTNEVGRSAPAAAMHAAQLPVATPGVFAPPPAAKTWSLSAWAFVRREGSVPLAPGGMLGGSQAGVRGTWRIAGPVAASLRLTSPLASARGAEAAVGLDWRPHPRLPIHLLVERRQKIGREGRSAFDATLYGGGEARLGPLRIDGYAQAGIVGLKRRDLFADGGARAAMPVGPLRLGAGAWAAAQPHVSRVDAGPHAELRLPVAGGSASLSADWRFRLAGNARPGSGPAITLAAGF